MFKLAIINIKTIKTIINFLTCFLEILNKY